VEVIDPGIRQGRFGGFGLQLVEEAADAWSVSCSGLESLGGGLHDRLATPRVLPFVGAAGGVALATRRSSVVVPPQVP
jgi:hypothetical protein